MIKWLFSKKEKLEPERDPTSLGKLLVDNNFLSKEELNFALQRQKEAKDELLGSILIKEGMIDEGIIETMLVIQKAKRGNGKDLKAAINYLNLQNNLVNESHKSLRDILNKIVNQHHQTKKIAL